MPNFRALQVNHRSALQAWEIEKAIKAFVARHVGRNVTYRAQWSKDYHGFERAAIVCSDGSTPEILLWRYGQEFVATHTVTSTSFSYLGSRGNEFAFNEANELWSY